MTGFIESGIRAEIDLGQAMRYYMNGDKEGARENLVAVLEALNGCLKTLYND